MNVGDKVKYSSKWLRSCGFYTGPIPFAKGEIIEINGDVATVKWDIDELPSKILLCNLTKKGSVELFD